MPPSPPQNIRVVNKTKDYFILAWDPPKYPETDRQSLAYGVYTVTKSGARIKVYTTNEQKAVIASEQKNAPNNFKQPPSNNYCSIYTLFI